jgi:hypothetical protein
MNVANDPIVTAQSARLHRKPADSRHDAHDAAHFGRDAYDGTTGVAEIRSRIVCDQRHFGMVSTATQ